MRRLLLAALAGLALAAMPGCTGRTNRQPTLIPSNAATTTAGTPGPQERQSPVPLSEQNLPGSSRRECVTVPDDAPLVRSGDFIAGDFVHYRKQWEPNLGPNIGKIFWVPAHPQPNAALTITATSASGQVETYSAGSLAYNDAGDPLYPSGIPLPTNGTWKLLAQAGDNWGCFALTLR
ncbi:hypothetical protein [Dactylosporangium sp. NPDC048998]|uniref:hypothetical protein n=1 Tax=Dactylosporangium sp. NPDC048998 TaxID=3363976 RepID=UPI00372275D3